MADAKCLEVVDIALQVKIGLTGGIEKGRADARNGFVLAGKKYSLVADLYVDTKVTEIGQLHQAVLIDIEQFRFENFLMGDKTESADTEIDDRDRDRRFIFIRSDGE